MPLMMACARWPPPMKVRWMGSWLDSEIVMIVGGLEYTTSNYRIEVLGRDIMDCTPLITSMVLCFYVSSAGNEEIQLFSIGNINWGNGQVDWLCLVHLCPFVFFSFFFFRSFFKQVCKTGIPLGKEK